MQDNPESGYFNPRIFLAFVLCSAALVLALLGFAASPPPPGQNGVSAPLTPTVFRSVLNGISPALRDLPTGQRAAPRTLEEDLPRVRPNRPVLSSFIDPVVQSVAAAPLLMPAPLNTFEGQSADDSGCGCIPPDTNGAAGPTQYVQMVNSSVSVYSKTGTLLSGPTQINALFAGLPGSACANNNNGDPTRRDTL